MRASFAFLNPVLFLYFARLDHVPAFFEFTKRLHNLIHGHGGESGDDDELKITAHEEATYRAVTEAGGRLLLEQGRDGDVIILHDPQPLGMAKVLRESGKDLKIIFRCRAFSAWLFGNVACCLLEC